MTNAEYRYIEEVIGGGLAQSPCLEMGVAYSGPNAKVLVQSRGIKYIGTDMVPGRDVDYVADFEAAPERVKDVFANVGEFGSVITAAILEHVFEPIKVLDNVFAVLRPGGTCVIIVPSVWPIHKYPIDCQRFNPDFFEEYTRRRGLRLIREHFQYIGRKNVYECPDDKGRHALPRPAEGRFETLKSRLIHKLFNTYGRGMFFPSNVSIGAVIRK
ncbi:MAG: methyltransferase domain-containing protein [Candidatus Omnitrophota bacterium]